MNEGYMLNQMSLRLAEVERQDRENARHEQTFRENRGVLARLFDQRHILWTPGKTNRYSRETREMPIICLDC